jgi:Family of unknown function (DUF6335)
MARKKPARTAKKAKKQAKKKGASRPAARKTARKSAAKSAKKRNAKSARKSAPARAKASRSAKAGRSASRSKPKAAARPAPASARGAAGKPKKKGSLLASAAAAAVGSALAAGVKAAMGGKKPNIDRPRKTVADVHGIPSSLDMDRSASAARTGRAEMKDRLRKNTSASPALTSGDVDADWEAAESVGDEAPGGDNPTPDQDVVDDIGRALGVEYEDDEELQGGAEIADRDRNRWELDPSSKEDDEDEER